MGWMGGDGWEEGGERVVGLGFDQGNEIKIE